MGIRNRPVASCVVIVAIVFCAATPASAQDCVPGQTCGTPPDVTGEWYIRNAFDLSQTLPASLSDPFRALRGIDRAVIGELNLPPKDRWLEAIIQAQVAKRLSPSLPVMLRAGDDAAVIVSTLRSEGRLRIVKGEDSGSVSGSEVWTTLVFYWLGLCGDNIGGDPEEPPECARFDIATSDNDTPTETPQCKGQSVPSISVDFSGTVGAVNPSQSPWQLVVDPRTAVLPISRVLLSVVGALLERTTPWHCIDEATDCSASTCIVDCVGLADSVAELSPRLRVKKVEEACLSAVRKAGRDAKRSLTHAFADVAVMQYGGAGSIDAGELRDGYWKGSFFSKTIAPMRGSWEGTRQK